MEHIELFRGREDDELHDDIHRWCALHATIATGSSIKRVFDQGVVEEIAGPGDESRVSTLLP